MKAADSSSEHHVLDFNGDGHLSRAELVAGTIIGLGLLGLGFLGGMVFLAACGG